jgi:hypothetical protein
MQHGGLIDLSYVFAQDLGIIGRMTPLHLVCIQISHCSLSSCLICGVHNLFRCADMHFHLYVQQNVFASLILSDFILQVFNNSPDETAYFRMLLNRESITNSVAMIQPSLISFSFDSPPSPVFLDVASLAADRILLLDAYFSVVIFHGMTIAQWRNMGYQNQPEHEVTMIIDNNFFPSLLSPSLSFILMLRAILVLFFLMEYIFA